MSGLAKRVDRLNRAMREMRLNCETLIKYPGGEIRHCDNRRPGN